MKDELVQLSSRLVDWATLKGAHRFGDAIVSNDLQPHLQASRVGGFPASRPTSVLSKRLSTGLASQ